MRIISGTLKGRKLAAPDGRSTRPTADRIKESIFNILAGRIVSRQVLDLFAGSGALGIEALSRGASHAVFIDREKAALTVLKRNIRQLGLTDRTRVMNWDIRRGINCLPSGSKQFDLVFMDPPYDTDAVNIGLNALVLRQVLAPDACVVVEHSRRETIVCPEDALTLTDQRRFGKTLVSFLDTVL